MNADKDTIDKMIERERYRKIAEKYRSRRNDRYRRRDYRNNEEKTKEFRIPIRVILSTVAFGAFLFYTNSENADLTYKNKISEILHENTELNDIWKNVHIVTDIESGKRVKVDEDVIKRMENDTYRPEYP